MTEKPQSTNQATSSKSSAVYGILVACFTALGLAIAYIQVAAWRNYVGWDSTEYMEIADQLLMGNWNELFGTYWSPLYPIVIAMFKTIAGTRADELTVMMWVSFFCFAVSMFAFVLFAHNLISVQKQLTGDESGSFISLSPTQLTIAFYISFLYSALAISEMSHKTPDVLASGICLLALSQWLPMLAGGSSRVRCALTGFFLGLTCWAKNFYLSFAPVVALLMVLQRKRNKLSWKRLTIVIVSLAVTFGAVAVPVSLVAGKPTVSEVVQTGSSWSQMFGQVKIVHGRGPTFAHPTRIFVEEPIIYEFATPFEVTYPPFYAPQYWYSGVEFRFSPQKYFPALWSKLIDIFSLIVGVITFALGICAMAARGNPFSIERLRNYAPGWIPAVAGLTILIFSADHHGRYYMIPLLLFLCFFLACLRLPDTKPARRALNVSFVVLAIWMSGSLLAKTFVHCYFFSPGFAKIVLQLAGVEKGPASPPGAPHLAIVSTLKRLGVNPGDRIMRLMRVEDGDLELYWAKAAGVKIVCESPDVDGFWACTAEQRSIAYQKLKDFGVKAIVQDWTWPGKPYPQPNEPGWIQVPGTNNYVFRLD